VSVLLDRNVFGLALWKIFVILGSIGVTWGFVKG